MLEQWNGFKSGKWMKEVNVRDFIQKITLLANIAILSEL
jgi:pyruvate-formate lyase